MTLKGDAKFKGKRACGLKNDLHNLVDFHASSRRSEKLKFDRIFCLKHLKFLMRKYRRVISHDTEE